MTEQPPKQLPFTTRFAPSPTGHLHVGHAYSALLAYRMAAGRNGRFILRIEDIDITRCKPEFTDSIYTDLAWLGIEWERPVRLQSEHFSDYQAALNTLRTAGLVYPCFCTRKDILDEIEKSPGAPQGPDGPLYPGLCRYLSHAEQCEKLARGESHAWRLNITAAMQHAGQLPDWYDAEKGPVKPKPEQLGDIVLARKDTPTSYHLSVVVDDALQGISHIVRGNDLFHTTHIHLMLQKLLKLPTPTYQHHKLLVDEHGERFAKRNKSATLKDLREAGTKPADLFRQLGFN